jgi:hypothetical protein
MISAFKEFKFMFFLTLYSKLVTVNKYAHTGIYTKRRKARSIIEENSFACNVQMTIFLKKLKYCFS